MSSYSVPIIEIVLFSEQIIVYRTNSRNLSLIHKHHYFYTIFKLGSTKIFPSAPDCIITALPTLLVVASTLANAATLPTDDVKLD